MKFSVLLFRFLLAVLLCAGLNGCEQQGQSQIDDEKEPHFIEGQRAVNGFDFGGAIDEFEKAVEANPHNASAHFELGWLYEEKQPDPAAAIYHYQQFLKLRPNADTAEAVRQRIVNCKQDLAKAVLPLPTTPGVQRDLEQLVEENKQLRAQLDQWKEWYKVQSNRPPVTADSTILPTMPTRAADPVARTTNPAPITVSNFSRTPTRAPTTRTYVVQARDTLASISRKYNVKLDAIALANPGVDARKLRVGQTLNIP
jgi:tetratricopeptide (TPR) repeat protein